MELTKVQEQFLNEKLQKLQKSKFRSSFKLGKKEQLYLEEKGLAIIEEHAKKIIEQRLAPKEIKNDGKQTPMHGHPVFIAQHATATCCRGCLLRWHHIQKGKELSQKEKTFVVALSLEWLKKQPHRKE